MFHLKKKSVEPELILSAEGIELYRGPLSEIPLSEETILRTCLDLYKDPQPCYIHRGAARRYLTEKITQMLKSQNEPDFAILEEYTGIEPIDRAVFHPAK